MLGDGGEERGGVGVGVGLLCARSNAMITVGSGGGGVVEMR